MDETNPGTVATPTPTPSPTPASAITRRWRVGLRTLLVGVIVLGVGLAWMIRDTRGPFDRIRGDWSRQEHAFWDAFRDARTTEARRKASAEVQPKPLVFASRFLELARSQPDGFDAVLALCWVVVNAPDSAPGREAFALLKNGRLDKVDPANLMIALDAARTSSETSPNPLVSLVFEKAKQNLDHPKAARMLAWVCANQVSPNSIEDPASFNEAANLIADRFAESPDISHFVETLSSESDHVPWVGKYEKHLRLIIAKNKHRLVRCTASFALANVVEAQGWERQDEAEGLFRQFLKDFDGSDDSIKHVENNLIYSAKLEAEGLRTRGIGKPAPPTIGEDLDGQPLALGDFRGKVVLVSFWATWCGPCISFIPHERAIAKRFQDQPFAIVGVNGDREPGDLRKAKGTVDISWKSFRNERPGQPFLSDVWKVAGWPTLYLVDHQGIIRHRWVGAPSDEVLNREIDRLIEAARDPKK